MRGTNYIQYLFFLLNVDNILHNNIIINNPNDVIEKKLGKKKANHIIFDKVLKLRPKFVCFNSMNKSFNKLFPKIMNEILK